MSRLLVGGGAGVTPAASGAAGGGALCPPLARWPKRFLRRKRKDLKSTGLWSGDRGRTETTPPDERASRVQMAGVALGGRGLGLSVLLRGLRDAGRRSEEEACPGPSHLCSSGRRGAASRWA